MRSDLRASMGPGCFHPRNAEIKSEVVALNHASMGPGCFHPRNVFDADSEVQDTRLQWGRDVSIPEMIPRPLAARSNFGFNGAGMFPSQKYGFVLVATIAISCFNGAGMFPSQK